MDGTGQFARARPSLLIGILCGTARRARLGRQFRRRQTRHHGRLLARRPRLPPLLLVRLAAVATGAARRAWAASAASAGAAVPGHDGAGRPAAGGDRRDRLHPGAARPRHHHPTRLRGVFGPDPRQPDVARARHRATLHRRAIIIPGLLVFGAELLSTIGNSGVGGDLMFVTAGVFWAMFGTLLRHWQVRGRRAVAGVAAVSSFCSRPSIC